ncbi:hypothetical protein SAMD00019534_050180 [Acytostelium subglobosum LB1]|uniref:hypothetical protein n=1 Tax=Acytostelium subglobosum LB1 TaxID=1410327 RepID=UPI00064507E5|nr:hypothetical protein SAMD00019534_050180 [Acytostelium subglobosum LB1]GAM21843.1 hypothetical protein SAMD00019534_050180 [Acytostelium subglobosum LB1]|eukprot:XP_012754943.1 hypothetical protein SAMD00019534_050180 [Acytostelium subglobosum LB1]
MILLQTLSEAKNNNDGDGDGDGDNDTEKSTLALSNMLCDLIKENTDELLSTTNTQSLTQYYDCIEHLLKLKTTDTLDQAIFTLLGTICFLFPANPNLLSVPRLLSIGRHTEQLQSIVFSTLSSLSVNQSRILAPFANDLFKYSEDYPNYLSILCGLYQHNHKDFESNLTLLIGCFEKTLEARASVLAILVEISKQSPHLIVPYVVQMRSCLGQQSLASLYSSMLRHIAFKYPFVLHPILDDLFQSISNDHASKYSQIELVGLCGVEKTDVVLEFLKQLLAKEESSTSGRKSDANTIVSILKALKSVQKTSPGLLPSSDFIDRYKGNGNFSEFVSTIANETVENIHEHTRRSSSVSSASTAAAVAAAAASVFITLDNAQLDSLDQRVQEASSTLTDIISITQLAQVITSDPVRSKLVLDTLALLPLPCGTSEDGKQVIYSLGGQKISAPLDTNSHHRTTLQRIELMQSIVNLNCSFLKAQDKVHDGDVLLSQPFIKSGEIKDVHQLLITLLSSKMEQTSNATSSAPVVIQSDCNTAGGAGTTETDTTATPTPNIPTLILSPKTMLAVKSSSPRPKSVPTAWTAASASTAPKAPQQPQQQQQSPLQPQPQQHGDVIYEGSLDKQSKFLRRYDTHWCTLTPESFVAIVKKESPSLPPHQSSHTTTTSSTTADKDDESSIKISLQDITEVKEVEKNSGGSYFTIKRVKPGKDSAGTSQTQPSTGPSTTENKSFHIVTAKKKYLFKAASQAEQTAWIEKLKHQIELSKKPTTTTTATSTTTPTITTTTTANTSATPSSTTSSTTTTPQQPPQLQTAAKKVARFRLSQYFTKSPLK